MLTRLLLLLIFLKPKSEVLFMTIAQVLLFITISHVDQSKVIEMQIFSQTTCKTNLSVGFGTRKFFIFCDGGLFNGC